MNRPLVSVITVVYNACSTIEATIKSVLSQNPNLIEYWIIDGGSTDGSLTIIKRYEDYLAGWISEPDMGIYDAMNKGIDRATGQFLYFLGADDQLMPNILQTLVPYFGKKYDIIYGNVIYDNGFTMHSNFGGRLLLENRLHHQSAFYRRHLFDTFRYDTSFQVVADYELNLRSYRQKAKALYIPLAIAECGSKGISSTLSSHETNQVRAKLIPSKLLNVLLSGVLNGYFAWFQFKQNAVRNLRLIIRKPKQQRT